MLINNILVAILSTLISSLTTIILNYIKVQLNPERLDI